MMPSTRTPGWAILLAALLVVFPGCADNTPEEQAPAPALREAPPATPDARTEPEQPPPTPPPAEPSLERTKKDPAPATPPATKPDPTAKPDPAKPEPAKPEPTKPEPERARPPEPPSAPSPAQKPVVPPTKAMAQDVVILTGAALGGVRLDHKLHAQRAGNTCVGCHHASLPQKPATALQQACSDCHTKAATPPMKTSYQGAFHDPKAQSGTCITCHRTENAKGKAAPLKCMECHKKENR